MNYSEEATKYIKQKNNQGRYSLFSTNISKNYSKSDSRDIFFDIVKDWDRYCNLPVDLGEYLDTASNDKHNMVAFSRIYIGALELPGNIESKEIYEIANEGLKNNGHVNSSGATQPLVSPSQVLSPLNGIEGWINLIMSYKGNNAVILYSLPKKYINDECDFRKEKYASEIYNYKDGIAYIKPEYLMGMIIKNKDIADIFLTKDDMLEMNQSKTK